MKTVLFVTAALLTVSAPSAFAQVSSSANNGVGTESSFIRGTSNSVTNSSLNGWTEGETNGVSRSTKFDINMPTTDGRGGDVKAQISNVGGNTYFKGWAEDGLTQVLFSDSVVNSRESYGYDESINTVTTENVHFGSNTYGSYIDADTSANGGY